jgi:hypothetical protein
VTLEEALQIIQKLVEENARLRARVEELERRLGISSQNSSKPPSSDPPWKAPKRSRGKGKKRARGWGMARKLVPLEQVDKVLELHPDCCARCGKQLPSRNDPRPLRHQVVELPAVRAHVTECRSKCRSILKSRAAFFTFFAQPGVEPTNNRAERALRHCRSVSQDKSGNAV